MITAVDQDLGGVCRLPLSFLHDLETFKTLQGEPTSACTIFARKNRFPDPVYDPPHLSFVYFFLTKCPRLRSPRKRDIRMKNQVLLIYPMNLIYVISFLGLGIKRVNSLL